MPDGGSGHRAADKRDAPMWSRESHVKHCEEKDDMFEWLVSFARKHIDDDPGQAVLKDLCKFSDGVTGGQVELGRCGAMRWSTAGARTEKVL